MSSFLKLGLAAAAVVAVVAAGSFVLNRANGPTVGGTPTPTPAASPVSSAAAGTYTSARYGFSMIHPPGWEVIPARADWEPGSVHVIGSQWVDELDDPNSEVDMFGARQRIQPGFTADQWLDQYIDLKAADSGGACGLSPAAYEPVEIQGEEGRQATTVCRGPQGTNYYASALVVHDGSAYLISYARGGGEEPGDDEAFADLVESFTFPTD